jgi:FkbM family methyltransferase
LSDSIRRKRQEVNKFSQLLKKSLRGLIFRNHYLGNSFNPRAARKLLGGGGLPVILEIGGADGKDSIKFCKEFKDGVNLIVFEPDPRHSSAQTSASKEFGYTFVDVAIGRESGEFPFFISNTPYSSSIKVPNTSVLNSEWPEIQFTEPIMVPVVSLDDAILKLQLTRIDLIWADVQGAEIELILGAHEALRSTRYLYTEFSLKPYYQGAPTLHEIQEALGKNWELMRNYGSDVLFRNIGFLSYEKR